MILSCNSCEKKFVVPDNAITAVGRLVQCSSCGNKWNQFPVKNKQENIVSDLKINNKKIPSAIKKEKITKFKKKSAKKIRQINLYTPEYLAKKHGIKINDVKSDFDKTAVNKVSFGFYNSLLVFIVISILFSRSIYFFQDLIVKKFPITEFYLNYFFESIKNIFEIIKSLIVNY